MDFSQACHRLRISPALLKWFTSYAPKADGRKLQQGVPGQFGASELDDFDRYLWSEWPSKSVPAGIAAELLIEACGHCALCGDPCEKLERAHIQRVGSELTYHTQHPLNLIALCGSCHNRYDDPSLRAVTLEVIQAAKDRIVSRKMESIDRDVARARAVEKLVEEAKVDLSAKLMALTGALPTNFLLWQTGAADLLTAAASGMGGVHGFVAEPGRPAQFLKAMSGSVGSVDAGSRVTQAVLDGYAQEASGSAADAPEQWELIEVEDDRTICQSCDPGSERPPPLVTYSTADDNPDLPQEIDVGHCDWCNGISVRCRDCDTVTAVLEGEYDNELECEGGCGLRFVVRNDYDPREGSGNETVEVLPSR